MADKPESKSIIETIGEELWKALEEVWPMLLVLLIGYLAWEYNLVIELSGLLFTIFTGWLAWKIWVHYIQQDFISGIKFVLLEIVPPREVLRSPKAMELFMTNALYHWSQKGGREEYWQGAVWFWFSLEVASYDGQVHFFIRTPTRVRGLIETQMYAQYPQAQIKEVEDYTLAVDRITPDSAWDGWGCEWALLKPEANPIRTYVDFGLDKDPKEELKVDPISSVIELFGSLKKGEQMWMQIVVTPSKKMYHTKGTWFGKHDWKDEAKLQIDNKLAPFTSVKDEGARIEVRVPETVKGSIEKMSGKRSKLGFDTGIRTMYIAKKEDYDMSSRRNIRLIFRQYQGTSQGLDRVNSTQADAFNTSFFPLSSKKVMILADRMLNEYRERQFFHPPMRHIFNNHTITGPISLIVKQFWLPFFHPPTYVLGTEELATLWHFPGQIMRVPTLERIESKEASPPPNLPI